MLTHALVNVALTLTSGAYGTGININAVEVEPNNSFAQANSLPGSCPTGSRNVNFLLTPTLPSGDVDYFSVALTNGCTIDVTATMPFPPDINLRLYDSAAVLLSQSSGSGTGSVTLSSYTNNGATNFYFVEVWRNPPLPPGGGLFGPPADSYDLHITLSPEPTSGILLMSTLAAGLLRRPCRAVRSID